MKSDVYVVKTEEYIRQLRDLNSNHEKNIFEVNGALFFNWLDYFEYMAKLMNFPMIERHVDAHLDWIRDLIWLPEGSVWIFIHNFGRMFRDNVSQKESLLEMFKEYVIPWWQGEVLECTWGVKTREFFVIITDGDPYT